MNKVLVCPVAFNENVKLKNVIERYLKSRVKDQADCLVVDDASDDGTTEMIQGFASRGIGTIRHAQRRGVGSAIRTAIKYARQQRYEVLVIMAGNGKDNPEEIPRLTDLILKEGYDFLQGSRYKDSQDIGKNMPCYRRIATKIHPLLMSLITGQKITDSTNGFRAFRLSIFDDKKININQSWLDHYELEPYLLYKAITLGFKFTEAPVTKVYPSRKLGYTKMRPFIGWWSILRPIVFLGLRIKKQICDHIMKLFGKNSVMERLRFNPTSIRKIYIQHGFKGTLFIHKKARQWGIPVLPVLQSKMMKIGRDKNTQGILADVEDFTYVPYDELLETALKKKRCLFFLDNLKDPQNLGAIIRSLACFGKFSIILPAHDSVGVTETVLRVACGGENYVSLARVSNLGNAIKKAKGEGFQIAGAVVQGGQCLGEANLPYPLGLVIGSEHKGIRDIVRKHLDIELSIPMACDTLSFNVAHATAVLCYEITRQKKNYQKKKQAE